MAQRKFQGCYWLFFKKAGSDKSLQEKVDCKRVADEMDGWRRWACYIQDPCFEELSDSGGLSLQMEHSTTFLGKSNLSHDQWKTLSQQIFYSREEPFNTTQPFAIVAGTIGTGFYAFVHSSQCEPRKLKTR